MLRSSDPAFPVPDMTAHKGITRLELFAALALAGLMVRVDGDMTVPEAVEKALEAAMEMMRQLNGASPSRAESEVY